MRLRCPCSHLWSFCRSKENSDLWCRNASQWSSSSVKFHCEWNAMSKLLVNGGRNYQLFSVYPRSWNDFRPYWQLGEFQEVVLFYSLFVFLVLFSIFSPFIAEQFRCDIPRDFHLLNIYVNEREKVSNKDKVIGRVSLSRGDILKFHAKEHWFNIDPVRREFNQFSGW